MWRSSMVLPEAFSTRLEGGALRPKGDDPGPRLLRVCAALDGHSQRGVSHLQDADPVHARRRRRQRRRRRRRRRKKGSGGVQLASGGGTTTVGRPRRRHGLEESIKLKSHTINH